MFLSPNDPRLSPVDFKISPSDQNILPQQSLQTTATKGVRHQSPQQLATPNSNPPSSLQHQVPSITVKLAENISQPNFNSHNASRKPHKTEDNQLALQPSPSALQYSKNHFNIPGTISQQSIPMEQIQSEHARSVGSSGNGISHREKPRGAINGIARESNEKPLYHQQHQPALHRYRRVQYNRLQYNAVQYSTVQYSKDQYSMVCDSQEIQWILEINFLLIVESLSFREQLSARICPNHCEKRRRLMLKWIPITFLPDIVGSFPRR